MGTILVTGATGRHGGTGAYIARRLRDSGHKVRVLARRRDERSAALEAEGFDVRIGDLCDRSSLLTAMEDIDQATFCFPIGAGIVEAAATFASALRQASPNARIVVMSMIVAREDSPSHLGRAQWLAEEAMAWSGLRLCVLRIAAMFYENIAAMHGQSIRDSGAIRNCFGDVRVPWIAGEDAAELMVAALLHPERFGDGAIVYPSGAELRTHHEIAEILSETLSRTVRYEPVTADAWRRELLQLAEAPGSVINADMAKHISAVGAALAQRGALKTPDAASLAYQLGRAPMTFRDFARSRAAELVSQEC